MSHRKSVKTDEKLAQESAFAKVTDKWLEHWQHGKSPRYFLKVETPPKRTSPSCIGSE